MKNIFTIAIITVLLTSCTKTKSELAKEELDLLKRRIEYYSIIKTMKDDCELKIFIKELDSTLVSQDSIIIDKINDMNHDK